MIEDVAKPKPIILAILDGFGVSLEKEGNPVFYAQTPNIQGLEKNFPFTTLQASGVAVGLPWGVAGNSEVGHLTMGAGRAVYHHLPRIINAIHDGSFFANEVLLQAAEQVKKNKSRLHLAGLVSSGSVHSYLDHLYALLDFAQKEGLPDVFLHAFTDGKDAPPQGGAKLLYDFEERLKKEWPRARLASVVGRFYAMDRDEKWERTQMAHELLARGRGEKISSAPEYLRSSYARGENDESVKPAVLDAAGKIQENDVLIFFNFREDSMRQIARVFTDDSFDKFSRTKIPGLLVITMTEYEKGAAARAIFPKIEIAHTLSRILGQKGLRHLHIAETQKYAHVTYFFNGGSETPLPGEERILIPSPATAHFEEEPQMKAREITEKIIEKMADYDVIIANFANADMGGHAGNFPAAGRAVEILDESVGTLLKSVLASEGVLIVTADHGNIELKRDLRTGERLTEHSLNPVPFFLAGKNFRRNAPRSEEEIRAYKKEARGIITDVAPTILEILGIKKPEEMTGKSLLDILTQIM